MVKRCPSCRRQAQGHRARSCRGLWAFQVMDPVGNPGVFRCRMCRGHPLAVASTNEASMKAHQLVCPCRPGHQELAEVEAYEAPPQEEESSEWEDDGEESSSEDIVSEDTGDYKESPWNTADEEDDDGAAGGSAGGAAGGARPVRACTLGLLIVGLLGVLALPNAGATELGDVVAKVPSGGLYPVDAFRVAAVRCAFQVLGKSCKPIPVMLMGVLFAKRRYPAAKYAFALLIVVGCALFLYKDGKAAADGGNSFQLGWGELLLLFSLTMDGTTGTLIVDDEDYEPRRPSAITAGQREHSNLKFIVAAAGIFCCYFYFCIFQEKITRSKYGEDKEPFTYTQSLVFVQCLVNAMFAMGVIWLTRPAPDDTPAEMYAACSFSYLAAMISSNHALQFIPYPTQVLGKSCKPIPVMLMGVLFAKRRYPAAKYAFALLIVVGCALFLYKDGKAAADGGNSFQLGWGELLLLFSLTMDGTTGTIQERIRAHHTTQGNQMMLNMNLLSTIYILIGLLFTGEMVRFMSFVQRFPHILFDMVSFSLASALGQFFIFMMVADFGPLPCSIVTTTRKFFTILASVIFFQNPLNGRQWFGTVFIFTGLVLDMLFGKTKKAEVKFKTKP